MFTLASQIIYTRIILEIPIFSYVIFPCRTNIRKLSIGSQGPKILHLTDVTRDDQYVCNDDWQQYWINMLCQLEKNVALWRCKSLLRVVPSNVALSREIQNSKQRSYRRFGNRLISSLSPYRCSLLRYILSRFFCFIL